MVERAHGTACFLPATPSTEIFNIL